MTIVKDGSSPTDSSPPSYELATTTAGTSSRAGHHPPGAGPDPSYTPVPPRPPTSALRALVPVSVSERDRSIKATYLVVAPKHPASDPATLRDAKFASTNGTVAVQVWFEGYDDYEGRLSVEATTTNASVTLSAPSVPDRIEGISLIAHTTNSKCRVLVPPTFHGTITLRTTNSRLELSEGLQQKGLLLLPPSPSHGDGDGDGEGGGKGWQKWRVGEEGGKDEVRAWSTNGKVWCGIAGEDEEWDVYKPKNRGQGGCCVVS